MVTLALLASCGGRISVPDTIRGLQIVAIEANPAQPEPFESLQLRTWVADGVGRGADVLVWLCTPYQGHCVEALPPGSTGLPLSTWTRHGTSNPEFTADAAWPLFSSIAAANYAIPEIARGKLLVWALACAPGTCPVIDQVAADPQSGSEAWRVAEHELYALAATSVAGLPEAAEVGNLDPPVTDLWIEDAPQGQFSLAGKVVPVWLGPPDPSTITDVYYGTETTKPQTEPNRAPSIVEITSSGGPSTLTVVTIAAETTSDTDEHWARFRLSDPDADPLNVRSFVTAGGVVTTREGDTGVTVLWQAPLSPLHDQIGFVVADDARGGTAVWTNAHQETCDTWDVTLTQGGRVDTGDPVEISVADESAALVLDVGAHTSTPDVGLRLTLVNDDTDEVLAFSVEEAPVPGWSSSGCGGEWQSVVLRFAYGDPCRLGGIRARLDWALEPRFAPASGRKEGSSAFVLTLPHTLECTQ